MTTAAELLARVMTRQILTVQHATLGTDCSLWIQGEEFVMVAQDGKTHRLCVAQTDAARLAAHWAGFTGHATTPDPTDRNVRNGVRYPVKVTSEVTSRGIFVNQAWRDFEVLGTTGDLALISYEMPNGKTYLVEISYNDQGPVQIESDIETGFEWDRGTQRNPVCFRVVKRLAHRKTISRAKIPARWTHALAVAS